MRSERKYLEICREEDLILIIPNALSTNKIIKERKWEAFEKIEVFLHIYGQILFVM